MARLKTGDDSAATIPDIKPNIVQRQEVTAMSDAMKFEGKTQQKTGEIIRQEGVSLEHEVGVFETAVAEAKYSEAVLKIGAEVEQMDDPSKMQEEYDRRTKQAAVEAGKSISGAQQGTLFSTAAAKQRARGGETMRRFAKDKNDKIKQAELLNVFDTNLKTAINTQDEGLRTDTINSMHAAIDAAVKEHGLSPLVAFNMKQKFITDFATGMALTKTKAQLVQEIDAIRDASSGTVKWKSAGNYLDMIPKDQLEKMYRTAKAGSAAKTALANGMDIVDKLYEDTPGITRAEGNKALRNPKLYKGLTREEAAAVRKQAEIRHHARQEEEATYRGAKAAEVIAKKTKKNGTHYTRAEAVAKGLKLDVDEQPAYAARIKVIYDELDEEAIKDNTAAIKAKIDDGTHKSEAAALAETKDLREDIRDKVKQNIKDIFVEQAAIKQREITARKQEQLDVFEVVRKRMEEGNKTVHEVLNKTPEGRKLRAKLTSAQINSLANGVTTDYARFDEITEMTGKELRDLDLSVEINRLAPAEFSIARSLKTQAGQGKKDFDEKGSPTQVISAVIATYGLGGKANEKNRGRLKSMFLAEVAKQERIKKDKLTNGELNEIANQMTSDVLVPGGLWDLWMDQKTPAYKIKMTNQQRQQIIEAYKAAGNKNPTQQQITDSFLKWQKDQ